MASEVDFCGKCGREREAHYSYKLSLSNMCDSQDRACWHDFVSVVLKSEYENELEQVRKSTHSICEEEIRNAQVEADIFRKEFNSCAKDRAAFQQSCWEKEKQLDALRSELENTKKKFEAAQLLIHQRVAFADANEKLIDELEAERDKLKELLESERHVAKLALRELAEK